MGKVTKKMLEEYRKTRADILILQAELESKTLDMYLLRKKNMDR